MSLKAVIFDIGGVLLTDGERGYRSQVALMLGMERLPDQYKANMEALQRGEIAEGEVWAKVAGRPVDEQGLDDAWAAHYKPFSPMLALASELRSMGVRTAILSNTQSFHVRVMRTMEFLSGFDPIAMSCEIGRRKPEPEAFHHVLSSLGLEPQQVAYVDDIAEYVAAGAAVGLHAIQYQGDVEQTRKALLDLIQERPA